VGPQDPTDVTRDTARDLSALVAELAREDAISGWSEDAAGQYTFSMADEETVLEEAMDNLKEAGQRIRATQSLMCSEGMTGLFGQFHK
jgi:hypothetical protein